MSDTKIDFAKVTQLLDAGWELLLFKNGMGAYTAVAQRSDATEKFSDIETEGVITDDFTPEQALTRLAYKAHGEII